MKCTLSKIGLGPDLSVVLKCEHFICTSLRMTYISDVSIVFPCVYSYISCVQKPSLREDIRELGTTAISTVDSMAGTGPAGRLAGRFRTCPAKIDVLYKYTYCLTDQTVTSPGTLRMLVEYQYCVTVLSCACFQLDASAPDRSISSTLINSAGPQLLAYLSSVLVFVTCTIWILSLSCGHLTVIMVFSNSLSKSFWRLYCVRLCHYAAASSVGAHRHGTRSTTALCVSVSQSLS